MTLKSSMPSLALRQVDDPASPFNYIPTEWICITFVALYGVSTLLHTAQATRHRMWWLLPTACLAGIAEVLGWSGRLWGSFNPDNIIAFNIQITCTILAPTPLVAANFIILGRLIEYLGTHYSRLPAKYYTIVFCTADLISLVIQGTGGGIAASAAADNNITGTANGGHIMLGGIVFQMVAISVYVALALEFFWRYLSDRPLRSAASDDDTIAHHSFSSLSLRLKLMIYGLGFSTLCLFIRAIYRTIELSDGWTGTIIAKELYFNVLDGAMVVLAMYTLNFLHPGILLPAAPTPASLAAEKLRRASSNDLEMASSTA